LPIGKHALATSFKHPDVIDIPGAICGFWHDLRYAIAFLTFLPAAPSSETSDMALETQPLAGECLRRATAFFPLVGAGIGLVAGLMLLGAFELGLQPLTCALVGLATAAILTRALHEDGLADFADGLGALGSIEKRMEIMRDSRIGAFGTLAVVFAVGIRASILSGLSSPDLAISALIAAGAASRAMLPAAMRWQRPARDDGLSAGAGAPGWPQVAAAALIAFVIALLVVGFWAALAIGLAVVLATLLVAVVAQRAFGGQTGDVLGAMQVAAEIVALAAVAMLE
jgi:adenosylcobinamide-GDP ribazoletransferase